MEQRVTQAPLLCIRTLQFFWETDNHAGHSTVILRTLTLRIDIHRAFSQDVEVAFLAFQKKESADKLSHQTTIVWKLNYSFLLLLSFCFVLFFCFFCFLPFVQIHSFSQIWVRANHARETLCKQKHVEVKKQRSAVIWWLERIDAFVCLPYFVSCFFLERSIYSKLLQYYGPVSVLLVILLRKIWVKQLWFVLAFFVHKVLFAKAPTWTRGFSSKERLFLIKDKL